MADIGKSAIGRPLGAAVTTNPGSAPPGCGRAAGWGKRRSAPVPLPSSDVKRSGYQCEHTLDAGRRARPARREARIQCRRLLDAGDAGGADRRGRPGNSCASLREQLARNTGRRHRRQPRHRACGSSRSCTSRPTEGNRARPRGGPARHRRRRRARRGLGQRLGRHTEPLREALAQLRLAFVEISRRAESGDGERATTSG